MSDGRVDGLKFIVRVFGGSVLCIYVRTSVGFMSVFPLKKARRWKNSQPFYATVLPRGETKIGSIICFHRAKSISKSALGSAPLSMPPDPDAIAPRLYLDNSHYSTGLAPIFLNQSMTPV